MGADGAYAGRALQPEPAVQPPLLCALPAVLRAVFHRFAQCLQQGGIVGGLIRHEVEDGVAQGVEVGPGAEFAVVVELFRGGKSLTADGSDGVLRYFRECRAEVNEHGAVLLLQNDVGGLDVAVQDAQPVQVAEGVQQAAEQVPELGTAEGGLLRALQQGVALRVFQHYVGGVAGVKYLMHGDDALMLNACKHLSLTQKYLQ